MRLRLGDRERCAALGRHDNLTATTYGEFQRLAAHKLDWSSASLLAQDDHQHFFRGNYVVIEKSLQHVISGHCRADEIMIANARSSLQGEADWFFGRDLRTGECCADHVSPRRDDATAIEGKTFGRIFQRQRDGPRKAVFSQRKNRDRNERPGTRVDA